MEKDISIMPNRVRLAEYDRQEWVVNAEIGTTIEDIKQPGYWAHIASRLKPYDHIEVRSEDGAWVANFMVLCCDRSWAKVYFLSEHKLTTPDVSLSEAIKKHEAQWRGPQNKWSVIRLTDREVLKTNFNSKEDAQFWIVEHEKVT